MSSGSTPTVTETMELAGDDVAPYFRVSYYKTDVIDGKKHYFVYVIYKMAFAKPDDSESTKETRPLLVQRQFPVLECRQMDLTLHQSDILKRKWNAQQKKMPLTS